LEQQQANLAVTLAGQEQALEAALLNAKTELLNAQQSYLDAVAGANVQEKARLQTLLSTYTTAVTTLNTYKNELAGFKRDLIQLEYGLVDAKTAKENAIIGYENQIAYYETRKATYEAYSSVDKTEAKKAYDKAYSEYQVLSNTAQATSNKSCVAQTELNNIDLDNSAYRKKLNEVFAQNAIFGKYIISQDYDSENRAWYGYEVKDDLDIKTYVRLYTFGYSETIDVERIYDNRHYTGSYHSYTDFYTVKEGFDALVAAYEKYIKENEETKVTTAKEAYDAAVAAEKVAETAAKATGASEEAKQTYRDAHKNTGEKKRDLDDRTNQWNVALENLAKVKEAAAYVTGEGQEAVKKSVDSYNALSKEICDLNIQYSIDSYVVNLKNSEANALWTIYDGATDIVAEINNCNTQITYYERQIADVSSIETQEEAIEAKKVAIANKEAEIALKEKEVDAAKAAFEAAAEIAAEAGE
jgi:hypothetical protein